MCRYRKVLTLLLMVITILINVVISFAEDGHSYNNDKYISNYTFDIETVGFTELMEKGLNSIASMIFQMGVYIAKVACDLFDWTFQFNLFSILEGKEMEAVIKQLSKVFLSPESGLFALVIIACIFFFAVCFLKGNILGIFSQIVKMVGIISLAAFLSTNTSMLLGMLNDITTSVSTEIMSSVTNTGDSDTGGPGDTLWESLVHRPWIELQLTGVNSGYSRYKEQVESLLDLGTGTEERQTAVDELMNETGGFKKQVAGVRAGASLLFVIVIFVKSLLFLAIAAIKVFLQIITIILVLSAPIILIISLVPQMGGTRTLGTWLKKIMENQIYVILLSLMTGFVLAADSWCYTIFGENQNWIVVTVTQIILCGSVVLGKDKIFSLMEVIGVSVHNQGATINSKVRNASSGLHTLDNANIKDYREKYKNIYKPKVDRAITASKDTIQLGYKKMAETASATKLGVYVAEEKENFDLFQEDKKREEEVQIKKQPEEVEKVRQQKQMEFSQKTDKVLTSMSPALSKKLYINTPYKNYKLQKEASETSYPKGSDRIGGADWDYLPEPREQLPPKLISHGRPQAEMSAITETLNNKEISLTTKQKTKAPVPIEEKTTSKTEAEGSKPQVVVKFPVPLPPKPTNYSVASSYSNELQEVKAIKQIGAVAFTRYGREEKKKEIRPSLKPVMPQKPSVKKAEEKRVPQRKIGSTKEKKIKKKIAV